VEKQRKKDVHEGTNINPLLSMEVNQNDPQIKEIVKHLQKALNMTHDEADSFIDNYAKELTVISPDDELIESHSIETLLGAIQNEQDCMLLEKICVQFRIQDVSEFNLERLSQKYLSSDQTTVMHVKNQTYQLFYKDQYLISKMNPY
jgi:hypothetical protein